MLRRTLIGLVALALVPVAQAGPLGQLTSDAPIGLYGDAFAGGSALELYHLAFAQGTLRGTLYSGKIIDHVSHDPDPCRPPQPRREETKTLATVSSSTPDPITFELQVDSLGIVQFGDEARAVAGSVDAVDADRPDAEPAAFLGPNPYAVGMSPSRAEQFYDEPLVPAFPTDPFLVIPSKTLSFPFDGVILVEIGNITVIQSGQTKQFSSDTTFDRYDCSPTPTFPLPRDVNAYHSLRIEAGTAVLTIDQGSLDATKAFYRGESGDEDDQSVPCDRDMAGHWTRELRPRLREAYTACGLPATSYSGANFTAAVDGVARFDHASGIVAAGFEDRDVADEDLSLTGNLELSPAAVEDGGKRMRTDLGGSVFSVQSPPAPTNEEWQAYAAPAA